jgi:peroxidase
MQNIVYGQYLPLLIGPQIFAKFRLYIKFHGTTYVAKTNPSINNVYATAAYRFGHSYIQDVVRLINSVTRAQSNYRLQENFLNATLYVKQNEDILNGMIYQRAQTGDLNIVTDVADRLFGNVGRPSDLLARNIQRGRDHGLPGYNDWRDICGLKKACSWKQVCGFSHQFEHWVIDFLLFYSFL